MAKFKIMRIVDAVRKARRITPAIKTDKGVLFEIEGIKGIYEIKNYDKKSKRFIFKRR